MNFKKPENLFLLTAFIFGVILVFIIPPFLVHDELAHFSRAFQISEFKFISQKQGNSAGGAYIPKSFIKINDDFNKNLIPFSENNIYIKTVKEDLNIPLDINNRKFIELRNTSMYSPVQYISQSIGIAIGKFLNFPPLEIMYIGRFFALLTWITLTFFAIKIIPVYKWVLFLIALMPTSLWQASSLSADAITNGLTFLFIATVLFFAFDKNKTKLEIKDYVILFALSIITVLCKHLPLYLLFLLIPVNKIGSKYKYFGIFALFLFMNLAVASFWVSIAKTMYTSQQTGASVVLQTIFIKHHPLQFISALFKSSFKGIEVYSRQYLGHLGWFISLPSWLRTTYGIVLSVFILFDYKNDIYINKTKKAISLFIYFLSAISIMTCLYLIWTPVGKGFIDGVLGRYFIAPSLLLFIPFYGVLSRFENKPQKYLPTIAVCFSIFTLITTSIIILQHYV